MNYISVSRFVKTLLFLEIISNSQVIAQRRFIKPKKSFTLCTPQLQQSSNIEFLKRVSTVRAKLKTLPIKSKKIKGLHIIKKKIKLLYRIFNKFTYKYNNLPTAVIKSFSNISLRKAIKYTRKYNTRKRRPLKFAGQLIKKNQLDYLRKWYIYEAANPTNLKKIPDKAKPRTLNIELLNLYMGNISNCYLGFSTDWAFVNPTILLKQRHHKRLITEVFKKRKLQGLYTSQKTFLLWYIRLALFRDPSHLATLMFNLLYRINLKQHKKLFFCLIRLMDSLYPLLRKYRKVLGFFVYFKGKLAKKGSVRKEKIFKKTGRIAWGTKSLRGNIIHYQAPTLTGTIGAAIGVFF